MLIKVTLYLDFGLVRVSVQHCSSSHVDEVRCRKIRRYQIVTRKSPNSRGNLCMASRSPQKHLNWGHHQISTTPNFANSTKPQQQRLPSSPSWIFLQHKKTYLQQFITSSELGIFCVSHTEGAFRNKLIPVTTALNGHGK